MGFVFRLFVFAITLAGSFAGGYWSVRLGIADWLCQASSVSERKRSTELIPSNSWYWTTLGSMEQQSGMDALPAFRAAAEASPLNAKAWMDWGLHEEISGNYPLAEKYLLRAAAVSQEYVPRWTLANYYFRRNEPDRFWPWAKQTLLLDNGDLQPIFRMAWTLNGDADPDSRGVIPNRPFALRQYLIWLTLEGKLGPATQTAIRLLPLAGPDDLRNLLYYCNSQIGAGNFGSAETIWNGLIAKRLVQGTGMPAADGVQNASFQWDPSNSGFDWRLAVQDGVAIRSNAAGMRVIFSGKEPESCEPLVQFVALEPNHHYQLEYEYETFGIRSGTGLAWRVFGLKGGAELTKEPRNVASDRGLKESVTFVTPPGTVGGRLALTYRRTPGTTRIEGWLQLKQVKLKSVT